MSNKPLKFSLKRVKFTHWTNKMVFIDNKPLKFSLKRVKFTHYF